jgi:arylsulfatase A-like enzyme
MLTGLYPREHGAVDLELGRAVGAPTLAGVFLGAGYDTRAVVSHPLLDPTFGLDEGFAHYDASLARRDDLATTVTSGLVADRATAQLAAAAEPFFLWVHFNDPHAEYLANPLGASFGDTPSDRYDQEVSAADRQIGRILAALRERGVEAQTLVAVMGDHGEALGERGNWGHRTVFDEVLRVPFLLAGPSVPAMRDHETARQIDLVPTLLALTGLEAPVRLPGENLLARSGSAPPVFFVRERPLGNQQGGVIEGRLKLMHVERKASSQVPPEVWEDLVAPHLLQPGTALFDLWDDPGETTNRFSPGNPAQEALVDKLIAEYTKAGVKIHYMTKAEFDQWLAFAQKTAWKEYANSVEGGQELLDLALDAMK